MPGSLPYSTFFRSVFWAVRGSCVEAQCAGRNRYQFVSRCLLFLSQYSGFSCLYVFQCLIIHWNFTPCLPLPCHCLPIKKQCNMFCIYYLVSIIYYLYKYLFLYVPIISMISNMNHPESFYIYFTHPWVTLIPPPWGKKRLTALTASRTVTHRPWPKQRHRRSRSGHRSRSPCYTMSRKSR